MNRANIKPLWLLVGAYWLWMCWACAGEWANNPDYSYGWFVPPLALYFWWKRTERFGSDVAERCGTGIWLAWGAVAVSVLLIAPIEIVRQTPIHWRPILWSIGLMAFASTLAAAYLTGGRSLLRIFLFPSAFMLLAIPWPTFIENAISFPLMQVVTRWSVGIMHLFGYPATAAGTTISLSTCTVGVEEACSGLRSLQTALMVGVAAGELVRLRISARCWLLLAAFVMAFAANQVRVLMLVAAGVAGGSAAVSDAHDLAGYVVLAILLGGVGAVAWAMAKLGGERRQQSQDAKGQMDEDTDGAEVVKAAGSNAGWVALATACAAMLLAHGWFWVRSSLAPPPQSSLLAPADGEFRADQNVPAEILKILRPDEYTYIRDAGNGVAGKVAGYHFYWRPRRGNANQLYHRPDLCMPGAGWRIEGKVERQSIKVGGQDFVFNVFTFRGPAGPALMLWGAFLNGDPVEIDFNNDVYLNTANLAQFIRTGTRTYSYEVAALIMPYTGQRPAPAEVETYANKIFTATKQ